MHSPILAPIVALVGWSIVMCAWMFVMRLPALKRAGIDMSRVRGGRPGMLDKILEPRVQWPAHNYMHLMEQPTLFYAIALVLALLEAGSGTSLWLAWAYVGLRIAHSIVQATFNQVGVRFSLFLLSTFVLAGLTLHAAMALFGAA